MTSSATVILFLCGLGIVAAASVRKIPNIPLKKLTTSEDRIRSHGYPVESHYVETSDGYNLNIFRIPYSHKLQNNNKQRPAILLQHGLLSNSDSWLGSGPDNSLAYLLADAGYDVWLGNARGNIYSRNNTKISVANPSFWRFSWHEIGVIDIAAMIDHIIAQTGESAIHYAGHSQGTTVYFVLMSELPEYNAKIKSAHMLAPCAYFGHGSSPIFNILEPRVGTPGGFWNIVLSDRELVPNNGYVSRIVDTACGENPALGKLCRNMYLLFIGDGYKNVNTSALQILVETHPAGASTNQVIHYIQLQASRQFRQYDHGERKNQKIYKQATPPNYDLSKITAPTHFYSSKKDALCDQQDVDTLVANMPQLADDYRIPEPSFNHLDFVIAVQMKELVNDRLIHICNEYENRL